MKVLNNSVGRGSPSLKNATLFLVKPLPDQKSKAGDYGLLERAVSKQMKKTPKKKKNPLATFHSQREMVDTRQEWHSLDKLVSMTQQKNTQIQRHIHQKAQLQTRNEQLKLMMLNPTMREHELNQKIYSLQSQVSRLKRVLEEVNIQHREQIQDIKEQYGKEKEKEKQDRQELLQKTSNYQTYQSYPVASASSQGNIQTYQSYRQESPKRVVQPAVVYGSTGNQLGKVVQSEATTSLNQRSNNQMSQYISAANPQPIKYVNKSDSPPKGNIVSQKIDEVVGNKFINVFQNESNENYAQKYPIASYSREESRSPARRQVEVARKPSPNQSRNTTSQSNFMRFQPQNKVEVPSVNISPPRSGGVEYKGPIYKAEAGKVIKDNQSRPISFAGEGGVGVGGVSSKEIDDIYKRYHFNDD